MKRPPSSFWLSIGLLALVSALAFLPFAAQMGFYFNDWHPLSGEVAGVDAYTLFKLERPGVGYLYDVTYPVLGAHPLAWQFFTFALRLGGVLVFFLILRRLWPEHNLEITLASLLMAVYPGFLQQPIALTFSNHFITLGAALLSIYFTVLALQSGKRWQQGLFTLLALLLQLCYLFVYEYMLGLEVLRLLLIGLILYRRGFRRWNQLLGRSLFAYLPYLLPLGIFLSWRLFSFVSSRPTTDLRVLGAVYQGHWLGMFTRLVVETVRDAFETAFLAWGVPIYQTLSAASGWLLGLALGLGLLSGALVWQYVRRQRVEENPPNFTRDWLLIGGISLLAAVFPVVLSNREVRFEGLLDRYTLHAAASASLLLSGLIFRWVRPFAARRLHAVLVVLAVAAMLANAVTYTQRWEVQRQLWWQLSWRAPQIKPDTALVAVLPPGLRLMEGSEIWTPANYIYYPDTGSLYLTGEVLDESSLENILLQERTSMNFRNILFTNKFDQMLLLSMPSTQSCLHVVDGSQIEAANGEDPQTMTAAHYSLIGQIMPEKEPVKMPALFGREPPHNWCYYYQRASLARQQLNWGEVARLGDEARKQAASATDLSEWLPFIEGYWNTDRNEDALKLSAIVKADEAVNQAICGHLLASHGPAGGYSSDTIFSQMMVGLCPP